MENINIVFNIDRNFIRHCAATINSIINSHKGITPIRFFVVNRDLTKIDKENLSSLVEDNVIYDLHFLSIDEQYLKYCPIGDKTVSNEKSISTYFRLFLPEILPQDIHKVIYLDADVIVFDDIENLWNGFSLLHKAIAGVPDKESNQIQNLARLDISQGKYINAGVLVMNLDLLREYNFTQKSIMYMKQNHDKIFIMIKM